MTTSNSQTSTQTLFFSGSELNGIGRIADFNFTPSPSPSFGGCRWEDLNITIPSPGMVQGQFDYSFTLNDAEMKKFLEGLGIVTPKKPTKATKEELDAILAACEEG